MVNLYTMIQYYCDIACITANKTILSNANFLLYLCVIIMCSYSALGVQLHVGNEVGGTKQLLFIVQKYYIHR